MADYTFNPEPKEQAPKKSATGDEEGGARIWNVFKPTIVLDEMSLPQKSPGENKTQKIEDNINRYIYE